MILKAGFKLICYVCLSVSALFMLGKFKKSNVSKVEILSSRFRTKFISKKKFKKLWNQKLYWSGRSRRFQRFDRDLSCIKKERIVVFTDSAKKVDFDYFSPYTAEKEFRDLQAKNKFSNMIWKLKSRKMVRRYRLKKMLGNSGKYFIENYAKINSKRVSAKRKRALLIARKISEFVVPRRIAHEKRVERAEQNEIKRKIKSLRIEYQHFPPSFIDAVVDKYKMSVAKPIVKIKKIRPIFNKDHQSFKNGWTYLTSMDRFIINFTKAWDVYGDDYYAYRKSFEFSVHPLDLNAFDRQQNILQETENRSELLQVHGGYSNRVVYNYFYEKYYTKFYWGKYALHKVNRFTGSYISHMFYNDWSYAVFDKKNFKYNNNLLIFSIDSKKTQKFERLFYVEQTPYSYIFANVAYAMKWWKTLEQRRLEIEKKSGKIRRRWGWREREQEREARVLQEIINISKMEESVIKEYKKKLRQEREDESIALYGRYDPLWYT